MHIAVSYSNYYNLIDLGVVINYNKGGKKILKLTKIFCNSLAALKLNNCYL